MSAVTTEMTDEPVTISAARLRELEAAAAALPVVAAKLAKRAHNDIAKLRAYDTAHPEKALERSKRYKERNNDAYLARRRELYHLRKAAAAAAAETPGSDDSAAVMSLN